MTGLATTSYTSTQITCHITINMHKKFVFSGIQNFSLPAASLFSRSRLRGTEGPRLYTTVQVWVLAGLRGAYSGRSNFSNELKNGCGVNREWITPFTSVRNHLCYIWKPLKTFSSINFYKKMEKFPRKNGPRNFREVLRRTFLETWIFSGRSITSE